MVKRGEGGSSFTSFAKTLFRTYEKYTIFKYNPTTGLLESINGYAQ